MASSDRTIQLFLKKKTLYKARVEVEIPYRMSIKAIDQNVVTYLDSVSTQKEKRKADHFFKKKKDFHFQIFKNSQFKILEQTLACN